MTRCLKTNMSQGSGVMVKPKVNRRVSVMARVMFRSHVRSRARDMVSC